MSLQHSITPAATIERLRAERDQLRRLTDRTNPNEVLIRRRDEIEDQLIDALHERRRRGAVSA